MSRKLLLAAGLAAILVGTAACGSDDDTPSAADDAPDQAEVPGAEEVPEPDLDGIPDVVAVVNGEEILRDEFVTNYESRYQQLAMQAQMSGEPVDQDQLKDQTAQSMVDTELLVQEADGRGLTVSDSDIDETLDGLAVQNGMESADDFLAALAEQGVSEDEVFSQLEVQVKVDHLLLDEAGDIEPTEEELMELYEEAEAQQEEMGDAGSELPPFDEVRPQLEEQARAEAENETVQSLINDLREGAEITVNLD
ncbi:SurA N-terminal domain-containing protein [Phytoactinopolyspora limicola]|uniref:SurA N-terminal domain-containing protein n=1 Tax=Phytoactinopolyspora limicola TaxID=2715536 RepID=UPI0014072EAE|nr:SurA N-terminal domain-containing protein [Phytoactinopolyspora limicola]